MLIKVAMTRGEKKRRITQCNPTDQRSTSILNDLYPDTKWLPTLPFDTSEFTLFVSDQPLGDEVAVKLPPVPYARPAGRYTRFEIQDGTDRHIRTSMEYPVTHLLLRTSELDHAIIAEKKSIYLGVGPAEKPEEPPVVIDPPEAIPVDTTVVVCPPVETTPDEDEPVTIIDYVDTDEDDSVVVIDDLTDQELTEKFLRFFLQHHVKFFKGRKLTSNQLRAAIEANAPTNVRTDLLAGRALTNAFTEHFGTGMEPRGTRIDGEVSKFWQDFQVHIHRPDPLERSWYDQPIPSNLQQ